MAKKLRRTPRGYDEVEPTGKHLSEILPEWLAGVGARFQESSDLVLLAWPEVIGAKFAPMARAVSFIEGVLTVKVRNSSLYSLLIQHEKNKLQNQLQKQVPSVKIRNIIFRLG